MSVELARLGLAGSLVDGEEHVSAVLKGQLSESGAWRCLGRRASVATVARVAQAGNRSSRSAQPGSKARGDFAECCYEFGRAVCSASPRASMTSSSTGVAPKPATAGGTESLTFTSVRRRSSGSALVSKAPRSRSRATIAET